MQEIRSHGCGAAITLKFALKVLGKKTIMLIPANCASIIVKPYSLSAAKIPILHAAFATAGAAASGMCAALDLKGDTETTVVSWAGDGGTFDIGFQSLGGARFIHMFASCATGWGAPSDMSVKMRLAMQTQKRFDHLGEADISRMQDMVAEDGALLLRKTGDAEYERCNPKTAGEV